MGIWFILMKAATEKAQPYEECNQYIIIPRAKQTRA